MFMRAPTFALIALITFAATSLAAPIENPADPPGGRKTVTLNEVWRAGGDDDEVFFGSVQRVLAGPDGNVLLLDNQLSQVQIYSADGILVKKIDQVATVEAIEVSDLNGGLYFLQLRTREGVLNRRFIKD